MLSILCSLKADKIEQNAFNTKYYSDLMNNNYEHILNGSDLYKKLMTFIFDTIIDVKNIENENNLISNYLKASVIDLSSEMDELLAISISCLQLFVKSNWLGPSLKSKDICNENSKSAECDDNIRKLLHLDGENILMSVNKLDYLYVSKIIFFDSYDLISSTRVSMQIIFFFME